MSLPQWLQREHKEFPPTHLHLEENSPLSFLGHLALLETFRRPWSKFSTNVLGKNEKFHSRVACVVNKKLFFYCFRETRYFA